MQNQQHKSTLEEESTCNVDALKVLKHSNSTGTQYVCLYLYLVNADGLWPTPAHWQHTHEFSLPSQKFGLIPFAIRLVRLVGD